MTWELFVRGAAEADLERLKKADQDALVAELFGWVESGPPRRTPREVFGVAMFDDTCVAGIRVTYVVDEERQRIMVVRIHQPPPPPTATVGSNEV